MSLENAVAFDTIGISRFPVGTTVKLQNKFLLFLIKVRREKFKFIVRLHKAAAPQIPFSTFKNYLKPSHPTFQDLRVLLKVCACLGIGHEELQKNVLAYRFKKSRIMIHNPVLPINVTPLFSMIVAHMVADGNMHRNKRNRSLYFSYRQYNKELRLLLLEKTEAIFGQLRYPNRYFEEGTRLNLPEVITLLICQYYGLKDDSFLSKSAILPQKIVDSSSEHLLAVLLAFLIDEGHIDSSEIVIRLKNEPLVRQLAGICARLGYENTFVESDKRGMATIYILRNGIPRFWKDYLALKSKFPCVSIGYREEKLKSNLQRFQKDWKSRGQNQTKNELIAILRQQPATVWELAQKLDISRQGIRNHIKQLYSTGFLERWKVKEAAFCYSLKKDIFFEEKKKGQSRPIGQTEAELKNLLKIPKTTVELVKSIGIDAADLRKILNRLHAKGEIKFLGWQHTEHMPAKIWQVKQ